VGLIHTSDGREVEYTQVGPDDLETVIYCYEIRLGPETQDRGNILIGTKVLVEDDDEEEVKTILYYLRMAESENAYLTEMPYLFPTPEAVLEDVTGELVGATGTSQYVSSFMRDFNSISGGE
jgi:hypothetical protein